MKNLIILSHNYHPFLLNEISYACNQCDKVFVISLYNQEICDKFNENDKVKLMMFSKKELHNAAIKNIWSLVQKEKRSEIICSIKDGIFDKAYIKELLLYLAMEKICEEKCCLLNIEEDKIDEWRALACWYASDAYALYKLKTRYPKLKVFSLAHSFEIDPLKSKNYLHLFRKCYHNQFTNICFISKNVKDRFIQNVAPKLSISTQNISVTYLGTKKRRDRLTTFNKQPPFHIVSCSYVTPIKRVEQIYNTLRDYANIPIVWTHIGAGKDFEKLRSLVSGNVNNNLQVDLKGSMLNNEIHDYYVTESIDLFINFSMSEGIPVSIMEAIAYGIPVIATDVGGNSEIVNENFGHIVDVNIGLNDLWNTILRLLVQSDKIKNDCREKASRYFEAKFNADNIRNDYYKNMWS